MSYYIGCDAHKRYSQFAVLDEQGQIYRQARVAHRRGSLKEFLHTLPEPGKVALETVGNWYWIVDEIEAAGFQPQLVHAAKANALPKACPFKIQRPSPTSKRRPAAPPRRGASFCNGIPRFTQSPAAPPRRGAWFSDGIVLFSPSPTAPPRRGAPILHKILVLPIVLIEDVLIAYTQSQPRRDGTRRFTSAKKAPPLSPTAASIRQTGTPTNGPIELRAKVVESQSERAVGEASLAAGGKVCAISRGTFVAVKPGHPAYHRW